MEQTLHPRPIVTLGHEGSRKLTHGVFSRGLYSWNYEVPEPLNDKSYYVGTVLGRQHVSKGIEKDSYFSKWSV